MKTIDKISAVAVFFVLIVPATAQSQDIVPSRIKEVVLFTDQALVKREAVTKVTKGLNKIILESEAFVIDRDSVQADVFGDGEIYSVQAKEAYLKETPVESVKLLEKKLEGLEDTRKALTDDISISDRKEKFLGSVIDFAKVQVPREIKTSFPKAEDLDKTLVFLDTSYAAINKKREELNVKLRELGKEIEMTRKEVESVREPSQRSKKVIEIAFNSNKDGDVKVEANYLAGNACWQPSYKADVSSDLKSVNMVMFSNIVQKTGEEWKGVKLIVSNVIPMRGLGAPSLDSWIVDVQKYIRMGRAQKADYAKTASVLEEKLAKEEMEIPVASFAQAVAKELPTSFEYEFPQPVDIKSEEKEAILPLFSKTLSGDFFYYAVPKISPLTLLMCKTSSSKEILEAPLNVYFAGRYVGKTFLAAKKPGEDFELNLGADREVVIKREKTKDKVTETTFFGKIERLTLIRELAFKITAENLKDKPVKIKILDNIPVSRTDKIEIKDVKITPEPTKRNFQDKEGVMLWEMVLKSKESKELTVEFTITYPKDTPVAGL